MSLIIDQELDAVARLLDKAERYRHDYRSFFLWLGHARKRLHDAEIIHAYSADFMSCYRKRK